MEIKRNKSTIRLDYLGACIPVKTNLIYHYGKNYSLGIGISSFSNFWNLAIL